jgi:small subunit ribosomal protein S20
MTHSKQAAKRVRTSERRRQKNVAVRTGIKSAMRSAVKAAPEKRRELVALMMSRADKAAKVGVIHKNTAARRKSRVQREINREMAAAAKSGVK